MIVMAIFQYRGRTETGELVSGVTEAPDLETAEGQLAEKGYFITSILERKKGEGFLSANLEGFRKVKQTDLVVFSRQLATMLRAGVAILPALTTLIEQTDKSSFKKVLTTVRNDVEKGSTFADALAKHPRIFSDLYVGTVRIGEETGNLEQVLERLGNYIDREVDLRSKVRSALTYPIVLIVVAVGLITFLVTFVLPKFKAVFMSANVPLPLPTKMMFGLSSFVKEYWWGILLFMGAIVVSLISLSKTERGRMALDKMKLRIFIFGPFLRKVVLSRFARSLETLVASGVDIRRSFEIIKDSVGNVVIARVMDEVRDNLQKGGNITEPLKRSGEFPPMLVHMVAVGEETGAMEAMLMEVANDYDRQVDYAIKIMMSILEPLLLVFMGGVVLLIALSLYLPLFKMAAIAKHL